MPTVIEVFADIGCPFTHLGLRRFVQERARAGLTDDVQLWLRAWPLELVNGAPLDPAFIAGEVHDLKPLLDRRAFARFEEASFPSSTLRALALAAAGYRRSIVVGEAVSLHLRALLFEEGQDVSQESVLERVATEFDLEVTAADIDSVPADRAEGERRGVIGSPHFFTPTGNWFCPGLDIARDADGHLDVALNTERFDEFTRSCLV
jgi:predicted DsbA family dithiol-disulfide isomerase